MQSAHMVKTIRTHASPGLDDDTSNAAVHAAADFDATLTTPTGTTQRHSIAALRTDVERLLAQVQALTAGAISATGAAGAAEAAAAAAEEHARVAAAEVTAARTLAQAPQGLKDAFLRHVGLGDLDRAVSVWCAIDLLARPTRLLWYLGEDVSALSFAECAERAVAVLRQTESPTINVPMEGLPLQGASEAMTMDTGPIPSSEDVEDEAEAEDFGSGAVEDFEAGSEVPPPFAPEDEETVRAVAQDMAASAESPEQKQQEDALREAMATGQPTLAKLGVDMSQAVQRMAALVQQRRQRAAKAAKAGAGTEVGTGAGAGAQTGDVPQIEEVSPSGRMRTVQGGRVVYKRK